MPSIYNLASIKIESAPYNLKEQQQNLVSISHNTTFRVLPEAILNFNEYLSSIYNLATIKNGISTLHSYGNNQKT